MKLLKNTLITSCLIMIALNLQGQMYINGDTLYGNEWIQYDQNYVKISIKTDGFYQLNHQDLVDAGVFSGGNGPQGSHFQLFHLGQEVPIYVSTSNILGPSDHIDFYAKKNGGEMDSHLYDDPDFQLNNRTDLFQDTSAYFLTWDNNTNHERYAPVPFDPNNLPNKEDYCFFQSITEFGNAWTTGKNSSGDPALANYAIAEGYAATLAVSKSVTLSTPGLYVNGPNSSISVRYFAKNGDHNITATLAGNTYMDESFSDWAVKEHEFEVPSSVLVSGNNSLLISSNSSSDDKIGIVNGIINYPRTFNSSNLNTFLFSLKADPVNKKYLEIENFNHGDVPPILFDLTNNLRIDTELSGPLVKALLPASNVDRELVLVSNSAYKFPAKIEARSFVDYQSSGADLIIVSHPLLMNDAQGNNPVQYYADYRNSIEGGEFTTMVADVTQLFDQYSYGVSQHEMALRNFTKQMLNEGTIKYLFLIGDGGAYWRMRSAVKTNHMIPSFGWPSSDHVIATEKGEFIPKLPVGRLAAQTPEDVSNYLNKVQEYEDNLNRPQTIEERAWMKRVLHLGGGDAGIQNLIRNELNELKSTLEETTFGGKVYSFFKNSTDVIQEAPSEQISQLINNGTSLISFFGHSAPSTLDFDLDNPLNYNNTDGKYPIVYAIGCHTSRMFEYDGTLAEQWILSKDKGAIAYIGATAETNLSNLSSYAKEFYRHYADSRYGQRMGDVLLSTIETFTFNSPSANSLKQFMILHGDPALKLNQFEGPDYIVDETKVSITPALINTQMDSFELSLDAFNIGSANTDSFLIKVEHELPSGTVIPSSEIIIPSPSYSQNYTLTIPVPNKDILGFNKLKVTLDALDSIPELPTPIGEMNNSYDHTFYVVANDALPVYPYEYSIVTDPNVVLKASTANVFAEKQKYYLEIDTTNYFNSPQKRETVVEKIGGIINWAPSIDYSNNTVYYWRISIDSTLTTGFGFNWHESSFIYKDDSSRGWNQSHFHQLKDKNDLSDLALEEPNRTLMFKEKINELKVVTGPRDATTIIAMTAVLNGGFVQAYSACFPTGIHVSVFDPITMEPWLNPYPPLHDSYNCLNIDIASFPFKTSSLEEREKLINFLENVVPDNHYVALYSYQHWSTNPTQYEYYYSDWALDSIDNSFQKNLFNVLEEQGATKIRELEDKGSVPYFFIYQKGNNDFPSEQNYSNEVIADSLLTSIEDITYIGIPSTRGTLTSSAIGPALSWQSLQWEMEGFEAASDIVALKLYGIDTQNNSILLHENISVTDTSLTHINAEQYPYLQLAFEIKDSINLTAPDLNYWRILYDPAPDAALRPDLNLAFYADTIQQGETLTLDMAVENITAIDMDSLLVHYTVIDQNNTAVLTGDRMAPLLKGETLTAHLEFNTRAITSPNNQLLVEVNPNNDQREQHQFNNVGVLPFYLIRDNRNPLLDVTFDGVHILDGDIVSAKPLITIALLDENPHLPLNDTSSFRIKILYPDESEPRTISVSDPNVTFIPAEEGNLDKSNKAKIEIRNAFDIDGVYKLIVDAKDATGNEAGTYDYVTHFEIINKAMVSNVFNYPNPFSTQTQFVFTLTGADIPDFMKIQIMSVSGKVIREITQDELGPLHVGKNMTDFRWDGTDEYGDRLGNGVYLYRVVTRKLDGELYDEFDTKTDQFFSNGIGKMVIIR